MRRPIFEELNPLAYQVDPEFMAPNEHSTYVMVLIEFGKVSEQLAVHPTHSYFQPDEKPKLFVPPLRLMIPLDYPHNPVQLAEVMPFRADVQSPFSLRIMEAVKNRLVDDSALFSITHVVGVWKKVVEQLSGPLRTPSLLQAAVRKVSNAKSVAS